VCSRCLAPSEEKIASLSKIKNRWRRLYAISYDDQQEPTSSPKQRISIRLLPDIDSEVIRR
jgi:hypothetical protein